VDAQLGRDRPEILVGQRRRTRHQLDMHAPEAPAFGGAFGEFRRRQRELGTGERALTKYIAHAIAEAVAQFRYFLVRDAAMRTGIAAVLHERDRRIGRAEHVVARAIDGPIQLVARRIVGQKADPGCPRNSTSSALDSRPRMAFRCG
jgi:hypothetical protein